MPTLTLRATASGLADAVLALPTRDEPPGPGAQTLALPRVATFRPAAAGGARFFTHGVPLGDGTHATHSFHLTDTDLSDVGVYVNGTEVRAHVARIGRARDNGTCRSVLLHFDPGTTSDALTIELRRRARNTRRLPAPAASTLAYDYDPAVTEFAGVPDRLALPSADYCCATKVFGAQITATQALTLPAIPAMFQQRLAAYGHAKIDSTVTVPGEFRTPYSATVDRLRSTTTNWDGANLTNPAAFKGVIYAPNFWGGGSALMQAGIRGTGPQGGLTFIRAGLILARLYAREICNDGAPGTSYPAEWYTPDDCQWYAHVLTASMAARSTQLGLAGGAVGRTTNAAGPQWTGQRWYGSALIDPRQMARGGTPQLAIWLMGDDSQPWLTRIRQLILTDTFKIGGVWHEDGEGRGYWPQAIKPYADDVAFTEEQRLTRAAALLASGLGVEATETKVNTFMTAPLFRLHEWAADEGIVTPSEMAPLWVKWRMATKWLWDKARMGYDNNPAATRDVIANWFDDPAYGWGPANWDTRTDILTNMYPHTFARIGLELGDATLMQQARDLMSASIRAKGNNGTTVADTDWFGNWKFWNENTVYSQRALDYFARA